jgi:putative transposase
LSLCRGSDGAGVTPQAKPCHSSPSTKTRPQDRPQPAPNRGGRPRSDATAHHEARAHPPRQFCDAKGERGGGEKNVLNRQRWTTREELRLAIVTWIEATYHRRRRQRGLGKLTPIEFETIHEVDHAA